MQECRRLWSAAVVCVDLSENIQNISELWRYDLFSATEKPCEDKQLLESAMELCVNEEAWKFESASWHDTGRICTLRFTPGTKSSGQRITLSKSEKRIIVNDPTGKENTVLLPTESTKGEVTTTVTVRLRNQLSGKLEIDFRDTVRLSSKEIYSAITHPSQLEKSAVSYKIDAERERFPVISVFLVGNTPQSE